MDPPWAADHWQVARPIRGKWPAIAEVESLVCSYCGCEAEPLITALMDDHAVIAHLAYRVGQALERDEVSTVPLLMAEMAERFELHSLKEEAGLFAELAAAGEAREELDRLLADHARLRPLLADSSIAGRPEDLRVAVAELIEHAETEDNDLFPYALQVLPAQAWDRINAARIAEIEVLR